MIWIKERRVMSAAELVPGAPAELAQWIDDDTVRVYDDWLEAVNHFDGDTDHVGNLPDDGPAPGTWLRFDTEGLNILGEDHEYLIAETVVTQVVGSRSFVFEGFVTDVLAPGSHLHDLYYGDMIGEEALDGLGEYLGEKVEDVTRFGVDSMYARIGFDLAFIEPYLKGEAPMAGLRAGSYRGQPLLDGLRLAWAFAKDIASKDPMTMTAGETGVAGLVVTDASATAELDTFITGLEQGTHLGDSLAGAGKPLMPGLRKLTENVVYVLLERVATAPVISEDDKTALLAMKRLTSADQRALFMEWRNRHMAGNVAAAAGRGVRYAGIGADHLAYLVRRNLLPVGSHAYDITQAGLADSVAITAKLRS
ncbi:MAG TPA: hypothetical protein VGF17_13770 [Phytomonospora sp.]